MTKAADYNLKSMREDFKRQGLFYTPPELALWLKGFIPDTAKRIYDPTCGRGALLSVFDDHVEKFGQDIDAQAIADASINITNFHGAVGDALHNPHFINERFDAIVANPPFSIQWEPITTGQFADAPTVPTRGRADFAFIIHIVHMLDVGGTAAVINFPGIAYRGGREQVLRKWLIDLNIVDQVIHIPGDTFTDTSIATICLVLKKWRTSNTIRFIDQENQLERDVSISEIIASGYTLSVSSYVQPTIEKEVVDPRALESEARQDIIKRLRLELEMSYMIAQFEGWDMMDFADDLRKVIDDFAASKL
jgi:type I restriction enzyme M protein